MYIDALAARPQVSLMTTPALNGAAETKPGETHAERERGALRDLEQFFLFTLLKEMRKTINDGGLFEQNASREYYDELLDHALSKEMARSGQLGLADMLEKQLQIADFQQRVAPSPSFGGEAAQELLSLGR